MLYEISEKVIKLENMGKKIIKFNVGDPDQQTPREVIDAALKAMREGKTKYGSSAGEMRLRRKLAEIYGVKPGNVVITPGSKWAIFSIINLLLSDGGNVVAPSPHWSSYELIVKNVMAEFRCLKGSIESDWEIDLDRLNNLIDEKTRMIIINNPNNPTSKVLERGNLREIVNLANDRDIPILSDESYADISFVKVNSILDFDGNHILVSSLSKTFAMTGWRVGFAILGEELVNKIVRFNQISITNVPTFIQEAALKALELKEEISKEMREIYRKRAELACIILSKTRLRFTEPDAPFYLFPKCGVDSEKLAFNLIDRGVAVVPGTAFGDYRDYFRISLTVPEEEIKIGLNKIAEEFT